MQIFTLPNFGSCERHWTFFRFKAILLLRPRKWKIWGFPPPWHLYYQCFVQLFSQGMNTNVCFWRLTTSDAANILITLERYLKAGTWCVHNFQWLRNVFLIQFDFSILQSCLQRKACLLDKASWLVWEEFIIRRTYLLNMWNTWKNFVFEWTSSNKLYLWDDLSIHMSRFGNMADSRHN